MKINKNKLKSFISNEVKKMISVDEDILFDKPQQGDPFYVRRDNMPMDNDLVGHDHEHDSYMNYDPCNTCGEYHAEKQCPVEHDHQIVKSIINEVCGCQHKSHDHGMKDYSLDSMSDTLTKGKHLNFGFEVDDHKHKHHKGSSYMSRPQLAKIAKYSTLLHSMIDEGEEIQDWQESKIAQISQMIGDVYHSLEYKKGY
jgi:hypothetical protein